MYLLSGYNVLLFFSLTSIEAFFFRDDVDCLLTAWSQWSEKKKSGTQTRSRRVMRYPSGRGLLCGELTETRAYDVDCKVSGWSKWSENFGFGQQSRIRTVTQPSQGAGNKCPELEEVRYTGIVPDVKVTANNVKSYFIRADNKYKGNQGKKYIGNQDKKYKGNQNKNGLTRDLVIIMDSSGSIRRDPFQDAKTQTRKLIGLLCPPNKPFDKIAGQPYQYNQAAMLTYSRKVEETFDFKRYSTTSAIQNAISRATFFGRSTNTAEAFRRAMGLFTTVKGARDPDRVKREVLILSDGRSDDAAKSFAAVESLKSVADVYGLITGRLTSNGMKELTKYVSPPINEHLFYVKDYQVLSQLVSYIEDSKKAQGPKWCANFDI